MSERELVALVAEEVSEISQRLGKGYTPERVIREVTRPPREVTGLEWTCHIPQTLLVKWHELPIMFRLGMFASAACDPLGITAGSGFQND